MIDEGRYSLVRSSKLKIKEDSDFYRFRVHMIFRRNEENFLETNSFFFLKRSVRDFWMKSVPVRFCFGAPIFKLIRF